MSNKSQTKYKQTEIGNIPEDWKVETMAQICSVVTDYVANGSFASLKFHVRYNDIPDHAVLIRLADYNKNFQGNFVYVNKEGYEYLKKSKLTGGEIIISNVGEYSGTVYRAPQLNYPMTLGPNSITLKTKYDDTFFYYWLKSIYGQQALNDIKSGSAVPKFNKTDFKKILAPCPPMQQQKQIAGFLSSLDDRIELNKKMNTALEEIGKALFNRWFVDFEFPCLLAYGERTQAAHLELMCYGYKSFGGLPAPESDKYFVYVLELENGYRYIGMTDFILKRYHEHVTGTGAKYTLQYKPVKIIHWEGLSNKQEAAAREKWLKTGFGRKWLDREEIAGRLRQAGGEMVESELGEIPKGWEIKKLCDISENIRIKIKPRAVSSESKYIGLEHFTGGSLSLENYGFSTEVSSDKWSFSIGDILFGKLRPYFKNVAVAPFEGICSTDILVIKPKDEKYLGPMLFTLFDDKFISQISNASTGTKMPRTSWNQMSEYKIVLSNIDSVLLKYYSELTLNISRQIVLLAKLNINLSKVRNVLLPRLMSGKLRVN
ncbi:restriction endonuclease subunit S [Patescibacteria group bacterium]|nr:restriction endonuclease subunit S [Patescibacteria group bacterium]